MNTNSSSNKITEQTNKSNKINNKKKRAKWNSYGFLHSNAGYQVRKPQLDEGQWLHEQVNLSKLGRPTVSGTEERHSVQLRHISRTKHEADGACYDVADNFICPINYHTDNLLWQRAANFICINYFQFI
jgi:hypothetical protein